MELGMIQNGRPLSDILVEGSYVDPEDIKRAEEYARKYKSSGIDFLLREGILSRTLLGQAIAEYHGIPYTDLSVNPVTEEAVQRIPEEIGKRNRVIFVADDSRGLRVATDNPSDETLLPILQGLFPNKQIILTFANKEDIDEGLHLYTVIRTDRYGAALKSTGHVAIKVLTLIFEDAIAENASDIHLEPRDADVMVRFRVDGYVREIATLPKDIYENILNKVKMQSRMRVDEHLAAQDGSLRVTVKDDIVDVRASVVPTLGGEKIAFRMLRATMQQLLISDLDLIESHRMLLEKASSAPFGMILVAGPTGSGKTTTLYVLIQHINRPDVNIVTIEDPVEYRIEGVNQIPVHAETGLTFADGLRSIVRQDPDIILVGEIRDPETASIAANAALTGHLLFSTFHAHDTRMAVPRLIEMGMEPFSLSSTIQLLIAQRLVRRICTHCRTTVPATDAYFEQHGVPSSLFKNVRAVYEGKGCIACHGTGYRGRVAIFEMLPISRAMRALMNKRPSADEVAQLAMDEGHGTLFDDGVQKVIMGKTTVEELLRVAAPPS